MIIDVGDRLGRVAYRTATAPESRLTFHSIDLAAPDAELPDGLDVVIHLAALPQVDYSLFHPRKVTVNNLTAHAAVLASVRASGIPLLFTSSIEVYGGNDGAVFDEDDALQPLSPYAASKVGCEQLGASYQVNYASEITTVRLTNLYGPWQAPDRVIPRLITQALTGLEGEAVLGRLRDFMYVDDAARAILALVESGQWGGTYNVSTGEGVGLEDAADLVSAAVGGRIHRLQCPVGDGRGMSLVASPRRLTRAIDWKPEISLTDGIGLTASWYRSHRTWWQPFEPQLRVDRNGPEFLLDHIYELGN